MPNTLVKLTAILNSKAPYSNTAGKDALDIALIFGSFEQPTSLFFQGDGVWQLIRGQNGTILSVKDYLKTFSAFEFYDIENIYICKESLIQRTLPTDFHIDQVQVLTKDEFCKHLAKHHTILRF